ncbi:PilZ domain-containing protein [Maridesulfovibrio sp. FT414]|uniref:PilZ domain-containing protein n=1 Tax=Maridesulfovibrio sp. FT414 TaxID=2979469 RepID=UPI003D805DEE
MDYSDLTQLLDRLNSSVLVPAQRFFETLPPEAIPIILAAAGGLAFLAALAAYLLLRPAKKQQVRSPQNPEDFADFFKKNGTIMDIAAAGLTERIIGRAVVTKIKDDGIRLEIIEDTGISKVTAPAELTLMFPPERFGTSRVNAFNSKIQNLDCNEDGCGRVLLTPPSGFALVKRRQHKRKRVVDQQFIRVKIWRGKPKGDAMAFADAAPDLAVNSYDPRASGHEINQVINISNGGIGVSAHQGLIDKKFNINDDVLINIFMFNFRQKIFKPYWYAGRIRSIEELDGTSYRIGVQFTMNGIMRDETEQNIDWSGI